MHVTCRAMHGELLVLHGREDRHARVQSSPCVHMATCTALIPANGTIQSAKQAVCVPQGAFQAAACLQTRVVGGCTPAAPTPCSQICCLRAAAACICILEAQTVHCSGCSPRSDSCGAKTTARRCCSSQNWLTGPAPNALATAPSTSHVQNGSFRRSSTQQQHGVNSMKLTWGHY
jgi:hypothetical protein